MCKHHFIHTSCTRVCVECGIEQGFLELDRYSAYSAPLNKGYQREVRFRQKIDKLISLQNAPPAKCPVWEYLKSRDSLKTPQDIRKALRTYTHKNKHYDCIRLFTRVFTPFRVHLKQSAIYLNQSLTRSFAEVLRLWSKYNIQNTMPFFSYDYLLRYFLERLNCRLLVFCKPVTCQKRHTRNNERMKTISTLNDDETYCRTTAANHSQSGTRFVKNRPCPQRLAASLRAEVSGEDAICRAIRLLSDLHAQLHKSEKRRGGAETLTGASSV